MKPIIEIKGIGKRYDITHQQGGYITLRDIIANILRSPFKFAKRKARQVVGLEAKEEFWALKGIDFNVQRGEVIGIIGKNGSGKSTLLKILTGITPPTEGEVIMHGKVASLLEVGTGFHPELTGRENVFLNGSILGMTQKEIARKFDEIVEFSGISQFIDMPVKRYSSGMYVRLAFSVAAHMEPDILLLDEVLAVGDSEFQKKCLAKMEEITTKSGRTILFVSHNLMAVQSLCKRSVLLEKGKIIKIGETEEVIQHYLGSNVSSEGQTAWEGNVGDEDARLLSTYAKSLDPHKTFQTAAPVEIAITYEILRPVHNLILGFTLFSEFGYELAYTLYDDKEDTIPEIALPGTYTRKFIIPPNTLAEGVYQIEIDLGIHGEKNITQHNGTLAINLQNTEGLGKRFPAPHMKGRSSLFRPDWAIHG